MDPLISLLERLVEKQIVSDKQLSLTEHQPDFHCNVFPAIEHGGEGTNSTAVIILSLLSGILCLSIIGYFVYHRRRVSGASEEPLIF